MDNVADFDSYRQRRASGEFPVVSGELMPVGPRPKGVAVVKVRPALPGIRSVSPALRVHGARAARFTMAQLLRLIHPVTVGRAIRNTLRGSGRMSVWMGRYLTGSDRSELRSAKPEKHHELVKNRQIGVLLLCCSAGLGLFFATPTVRALAGGLVVVVCALVGRRGEKVMAQAPKLGGNETLIRQAFVHARIAKDVEDIRLVAPVQRQGSSWTTTVQLPPGTAASKVVGQRDQLASALHLPAHRLLVTHDEAHAGRIKLRASDQDPLAGTPVPNPLVLAPRPVDLWSPLPIGVDVTGRTANVDLVFSGMLIGGLPRRGKSVAAANVLVGALLDPHCQLWLIDGKGLDSRPLIPHATHFVGADIDDFAAMMTLLEKEMDRRYQRLAQLELDKLNRKVCHAEMPLIMLSIDELARYTADQDKIAKRAVNTLRNIVSVGPAAGIIPLLATQKPSSKIVPTDIRDLIPIRLAVACSTRAQSTTILGDEATVSAADLPKSTPGAAWLAHETTTMIRPYLVDGAALREVAAKVHGTRPVAEPLAAVLAAMGDNDRMRSADLASRLCTTQNDLAAVLSPYGIRPRQLGGEGNPRGYKRSDILVAIQGAPGR